MFIFPFSVESFNSKSPISNLVSLLDDSNLNKVFGSESVSPHFIPINIVYTKDSDGMRV